VHAVGHGGGSGRRRLILLLVLAALAGCGGGRGARSVTLEGEIIDPQCYFTHGGRGLAHRDCALLCARGGQGLAFLNRAGGRVYPIIAHRHGANPNDSLYAVVGYPVLVRGTLYEVQGQRALLVTRAEALPVAGGR
jgi:hypothetical protein